MGQANKLGKNQRKYIRHKPLEEESFALIDLDPEHTKHNFEPKYSGLIISESSGGAGIVIRKNPHIKAGDVLIVKIGQLFPIRSQVVWCDDQDEHLIKLGLKYLE